LKNEAKAKGAKNWFMERIPNEAGKHRVKISRAFYLGMYVVTQAEYRRVMNSNPSKHPGDMKPVDNMSWDDAVEFCRRLSEVPGEKSAVRHYCLPTEAQWEYACRAGSTTRFSFGDNERLLSQYGWSNDNSANQTHPVGEKRPNAWGLYDMHGNVREWCNDWFDGDYYAKSPANDPTGPTTGKYRVMRAGSYYIGARGCRAAFRMMGNPSGQGGDAGFRVAVTFGPRK
jgi:formylglycine-generating enzyme required for sulfatase activity